MSARRPASRGLWLTAGLVAAALLVTLAFLGSGTLGLVIAADVAAVLALLVILGTAPRTARPRRRAGAAGRPAAPAGARSRGRVRLGRVLWTGARRAVPGWARARLGWTEPGAAVVSADGFPTYRKISADLGWAGVSRRHYDHATRRLLLRLLEERLRERRAAGPAEAGDARHLIGEELWPLLDPARPACSDTRVPGVGLATVARIVGLLERL